MSRAGWLARSRPRGLWRTGSTLHLPIYIFTYYYYHYTTTTTTLYYYYYYYYFYYYLARSRLGHVAQVHTPVELRLLGAFQLPASRGLGGDREGEHAARLCEQGSSSE